MMNCSLQYNKENKNITLSSDTACIWTCVVKSGNITLNPYWGELSANSTTNITIWTYGTEELFGNVICRFDDGNCQVIKEETVRSSNLGVFYITNRDLYLFGEGTKSRFYVYYGIRQTKWNDILSSVEFIYGENNQSILSYSGSGITETVKVEGYELYDISCSKYNEGNGYFEVTITSLSGVAFNDSFIIKAKSFEGEGNSVGDLYQHYTINVYQEVIENRPTVFKITPNVIHLSSMFPKQRVSVISLYEGQNQPYNKVTNEVNTIINPTEQYLLGQNITNKNEVMVLNEPITQNHADLVDITPKSSYIEVDISNHIDGHEKENGTVPHQLYFAMKNNTSYSGMLTYYYTHIQIPNNELYFQNINNVYAYVDVNSIADFEPPFETFSAKTISIYFTKNEEIVQTIKNCYYVKYDVNKLVNFEIYSNPSKWIIERQSLYTDEVQRDKLLSLQLTDNIPSNSYETIQLFNNKAAYASIRVYSDEIFVKDKYAFNFGKEEYKDKVEEIILNNNTNSAFTINILSQNSEFKEISWLEETKTIKDGGIEGYLNVKALYYKIKNDTNSSSTSIKIDENQNIKKMDSVIYEPQIIDYQFKIKYKVDINKYYITYGILHDKKIGNNVEKELKDTNEYFFEHKDNLYKIEIPQPYIGHDIGWYVSHRGNGIKFNVKRYSNVMWEEISEGEIASKGGYNVNGNSGETQIHIINQVFTNDNLPQSDNFKEGDVLLFPKTMIENTITETIELQQEKTLQVLTIYITLSGNSTTESNEVFRIGQLGEELTTVTSTTASDRTTCTIDTYDDAVTLVYESYKKNNSFSKTEKDVILNISKRFELKPYFENVSELNNIANQDNAFLLGSGATYVDKWSLKDGKLNGSFIDDNKDIYVLPSNGQWVLKRDNTDTNAWDYKLRPKNSIFFNKKYIFETETDENAKEISGTVKDFDITYQILEKVVTLNGNHYILDGENNVSYNNKIYKAFEDNDKLKLSFDTVLYDLKYKNKQWCFDNDEKKLDNNLSYISNGEVFYPNFKAKIPSSSTIEILESVDGNLEKLGFMDVDDYIILSYKKYNLNVNGDMVCLDDNKTLEVTSATTAKIENGLEINPSLNRAYDYVIINDEKYQLIDNKLIYENEVYYPQTYNINSTTTLQNMFVINRKGYSAMTQEAENYVLINNNKCPIDGDKFYFYQINGDSNYEYYQVENVIKETFKYSIDLNNLLGEDIIVGKYNNSLLLVDGYVQINGKYYQVEKKHSINTNVYPYKVETKYFVKINNNEYDVLKNVIQINDVIYNVTQVNNQDAVIINYNTYFVQNGQILYSGQTYDVHERCINSGNTLIDVIKFTYQDDSNDNKEKDNNVVYGYISNGGTSISVITYEEVLENKNNVISYQIYLPTYYIENKYDEGQFVVSGYTLSNITNINTSILSYNKANINYYSYNCTQNGNIELTTKNIVIENGNFTIDIDEYRVVKYHSLNEYWYTNKDNGYLVYPSNEDKKERYEVSVWDWYANKMLPMVKIYDSVEIKNGTVIGNITLTNIEYEVEENNYVKIRDEIQDLSNAISSSSVTINQVFQIPYDGDGYIKICLDEINDNEFICLPLTFLQERPILTYGAFTFSNIKFATLPEQLLQSIRGGDYVKCKIFGPSSSQKNINIIIIKPPFENIDNNNNTVTIQEDIPCIIHTDENNLKYIDLNLDMYAAPTFLLKYLPSYQTYGNGKVFSLQKINDTDYEVFNVDIENNNVENVKYGRYTVDFNQQDLDVKEYFTITSLSNQTIKLSNPNFQTLEMHISGQEEWEKLVMDGVIVNRSTLIEIQCQENSIIEFRGQYKNNSNSTAIGTFICDQEISVKGNILSLFYYTNFDYEIDLPTNVTLEGLFKGCTKLTDAKNLLIPIEEVPNNGLKEMFYGCTSLETAPELLATKLAPYCYNSMFYGCTSLETAPELPATTLADNCYESMFYGCTSLETAPQLPATKLAERCYMRMFQGCTSLETAPELLATKLAERCYAYMFETCTSLYQVFPIKCEQISIDCCKNMFKGCKNLYQAPQLEITLNKDIESSSALSHMFEGCVNLERTSPITISGENTKVDELFQSMFKGCKNLQFLDEIQISENLSILSETNQIYENWLEGIASNGYYVGYFWEKHLSGKSWEKIDKNSPLRLPLCIMANNNCKLILSCENNGKIFYRTTLTEPLQEYNKDIVINSTEDRFFIYSTQTIKIEVNDATVVILSGNSMSTHITSLENRNYCNVTTLQHKPFRLGNNCIKVLQKAPELPATTLVSNCYESMFGGCTSLTEAPQLPATTLANGCYAYMFLGCRSLTEAPQLLATTLATQCYSGMFYGCRNLNYIKMLATDISAYNCLSSWVSDVATEGIFVKSKDATWDVRGTSGIPSGWTETINDDTYNKLKKIPLTIHANEDCIISNTFPLTYIDDKNEQHTLSSNTPLQLSKNDICNFYQSNEYTGGSPRFSISGNCSISGNVLSIYTKDWETKTVINDETDSFSLQYLFLGCSGITSADNLIIPFLKIEKNGCCQSMFQSCINLTTAPKLYATTLASSCYSNMFSGCTSLTTAPELPATKLASSCYSNMFNGCTSLTTAPELPATKLASSCYQNMFWNCTSLKTAPQLLATTLASSCYQNMFWNCTSLKTAPELLATELASYCCYRMFRGCTSLETAPELPATTLAPQCYQYMFEYCTSLKTAPELPATELASSCYSNMFKNCTSLETAPQLPATKLAEYCYSHMFVSCTSLEKALELPAATLAKGCYEYMFDDCTSLKTAPQLSATTLAYGCYYFMFWDCKSLTEAPELPATELADSCYYGMFDGCTSLKKSPELLATKLAPYCYSGMFYGCRNLNYIKMLATNISADMCLHNWVNGVATEGTFVKNAAMTSLPSGDNSIHGIPKGWTVENA